MIDCSTGGVAPQQQIKDVPGFQVPFAQAVKEAVKIHVGTVGKITEPTQAEEIVKSNKADFVLLARELLRNPEWPLKAAAELGVEVDYPLQYERAKYYAEKR